ncbi:MAG: hypothetical protein K2W85_10230 [Phycisphaerales bacterium]|nr:hypothetical protein [Phycisphaerales bacterium]
MIRRLTLSIAFAFALQLAQSTALAQGTCGTPPTNVLVASAVCNTSVRISWTNPVGVGIVNPKVWRSSTTNFADGLLVFAGGSGSPTIIFNAPPTTNANYYYWVGGDVFGCGGAAPTQTRPLPMVGPLPAGVFPLNAYPPPIATTSCQGVNLTWQPCWDASALRVVRAGGLTGSTFETITSLNNAPANPVTSFVDTLTTPGNVYFYGLYVESGCGTSTGAGASATLRGGPWTSVLPTSAAVNVGQTATLSIGNALNPAVPVQQPAPASIQWSKAGVILNDGALGGRVSGATTQTLSIAGARLADAGEYLVRINPYCPGSPVLVFSTVLSVTQTCRADFDQNGAPTAADIFEFLNAWFAGCP